MSSIRPKRVGGVGISFRLFTGRSMLPAFAGRRLEDITTAEIERWRQGLGNVRAKREAARKGKVGTPAPPLSNASKNRIIVTLHGIFRRACKVCGLPVDPASGIERHPERNDGDIEVFSPEEVWALVEAAASKQDGTLFLTAACTGLRRREHFKGEDDLVFAGATGSHIDGSELQRRYETALADAGLRSLRFHDLRHTLGTRMIAKADIRRVQEWMGHADVQTTMRRRQRRSRDRDDRMAGWTRHDARAALPGSCQRPVAHAFADHACPARAARAMKSFAHSTAACTSVWTPRPSAAAA